MNVASDEAPSNHALGGTEENITTLVKIAGVLAEVRTGQLLNISTRCQQIGWKEHGQEIETTANNYRREAKSKDAMKGGKKTEEKAEKMEKKKNR
jgi:hypothetical protein